MAIELFSEQEVIYIQNIVFSTLCLYGVRRICPIIIVVFNLLKEESLRNINESYC